MTLSTVQGPGLSSCSSGFRVPSGRKLPFSRAISRSISSARSAFPADNKYLGLSGKSSNPSRTSSKGKAEMTNSHLHPSVGKINQANPASSTVPTDHHTIMIDAHLNLKRYFGK
mmetsp:Transcript_27246/g.37901  ORF Transcript_27246/g.37901 Transcript_27246/m.37901 type:complete len:114 (-) Transcript_27246:124-465(-)